MQFLEVSGVPLEYAVTGDGPELVFLHGLTGCVEMERRLAERLGSAFTVLWYSSRGHGRSGEPSERSGWGYDVLAGDLQALIEHVGFERPFLAGGSHGANTILRHAVEFPGVAAGAAVIAPGGNALRRPPRVRYTAMRLGSWLLRTRHPDAWLVRMLTGMDPAADGQDPVTVAAAQTHDLRRLARAMRFIPDQAAVDPARLAAVELPCVVSAWADDPIIHPIDVAREIAEALPRARFEEIRPLIGQSPEEQAAYAVERIVSWHAELTAAV